MATNTGDADSEMKKQRTDGSHAPNTLTAKELSGQSALLLFYGVCNLCQGIAKFIIARDPEAKFRFASLQSDIGQRLLQEGGMASQNMDTFVMIDNGRYYTKSSAALKVVSRLGGLWPLLYALIAVPPFLRNGVYGLWRSADIVGSARKTAAFCLRPTFVDVLSTVLGDLRKANNGNREKSLALGLPCRKIGEWIGFGRQDGNGRNERNQ